MQGQLDCSRSSGGNYKIGSFESIRSLCPFNIAFVPTIPVYMDGEYKNSIKLSFARQGEFQMNPRSHFQSVLELRKTFQLIRVRYKRAKQRILVDINSPVASILPLISKKFQLENIQNCTIQSGETSTFLCTTCIHCCSFGYLEITAGSIGIN